MAFKYRPPPIEKFLPSNLMAVPSQFLNARESCLNNQSLIQVAKDLNITTEANLNISSIASPIIDDLDFSGIANGLDLASTITLTTTPTAYLASLTNLDLSGLVTTDLVTIRTNTIPDLVTQLTNLKNGLDTLASQDDAALLTSLTVNGDNTKTAAQNQASALADFKSRLTTTSSNIDDLIKAGGTIESFKTQITNLETLITNLRTKLSDMKTTAASVPKFYDDAQSGMQTFSTQSSTNVSFAKKITNSVPTIKSNIKSGFQTEEARFLASLNCSAVGKQLYAVEDAICSKAMYLSLTSAGFDSLWLSYSIIVVAATCSIFAIPYAMNRIFQSRMRVDPEYDADDQYLGQTKKSSIVKSSSENIPIVKSFPLR